MLSLSSRNTPSRPGDRTFRSYLSWNRLFRLSCGRCWPFPGYHVMPQADRKTASVMDIAVVFQTSCQCRGRDACVFPGPFRGAKKRKMSFTEICVYQVKPQKVEEFEALMLEAKSFLEKQQGLLLFRLVKRGYRIDMEQIREGLPPLKLTRVVKSVKYILYWEFDTKESYGVAQKSLYDSYWKSIDKCLIVPHDKYLGEPLF